ncbi:MAG: undecaprenyl-phosphate glucose phosphotransferase [Methanobrevibacter sp.]|jgi:Undecaprenyl-phosphate glucose phosphotransferase|nr:undecaprenyl-phosphate glucose phosphotransferase [Methanobrevibacter sp.]
MIKQNQRFFNAILIIIDGLILLLALFTSWFVRFQTTLFGPLGKYLDLNEYLLLMIFIIPFYIVIYYFLGLYKPFRDHSSVVSEASQIIKANFIVFLVLISILFIIDKPEYSRWMLFLFGAFSTIFGILERSISRSILKHIRTNDKNLKHVLIIGTGDLACKFAKIIFTKPFLGYHISGFLGKKEDVGKTVNDCRGLKVLGSIDNLNDFLSKHAYDRVIIAIPLNYYRYLDILVDICEDNGVTAEIIPDYYKYLPAKPYIDMIEDMPIINIRYVPLDNPFNGFVKKSSDIIISLIAIVITSPIMIITAILIKLTSPGPIIFKQERIGFKSKPFLMYKFRSMRVQDELASDSTWTTENDPRKTKIGEFIRRTSIDELPQFFNVLKGQMSVVGPRPERPFFVKKFKNEVPKYMVKHQVRPGLTGWAQIHGFRGNTSIKQRIKYDIEYVEHWNISFDILIMVKTITKGNENAY